MQPGAGACLRLIPTPGGVLVFVVAVGASDMWSPFPPADAEGIENVGLAPQDRGTNISSPYEAIDG
jgi:hypothetical protein